MTPLPALDDAFCPRYHHAVELVGKRWTGAILRALLAGRSGYTELRATVPGLTDTMLSARLRELEAEGIVERSVDLGPPTRTHYLLTERGHDLEAAVAALSAWAERWIPATADSLPAGSEP